MEEAKELDVVLVPYENERGMEATREIFRSIPEGASIGVMMSRRAFFPEEIAQLDKDMHRISLGRRILRTETAGMATLSMLIYELVYKKGKNGSIFGYRQRQDVVRKRHSWW